MANEETGKKSKADELEKRIKDLKKDIENLEKLKEEYNSNLKCGVLNIISDNFTLTMKNGKIL